MIKLSFKIFAVLTVAFFILATGVLIAVKTNPPEYIVSDVIVDGVYPTAREHLKGKFIRMLLDLEKGKDIREFEITEIEANAYIRQMFDNFITPSGMPIATDPYLFMSPGKLKLRFDIPFGNMMEFIGNKMDDMDLDDNLKAIATEKGSRSKMTITVIVRVYWVEKESRPFFYLEKIYIGALPVAVPLALAEYQQQLNDNIWGGYERNMSSIPVYIKKIEAREKIFRFDLEPRVTSEYSFARQSEKFLQANPELGRAMESKNCLYGCTQEEWDALQKYHSELKTLGARDIKMTDAVRAQAMVNMMKRRDAERRENPFERRKEYEPETEPDVIIYPERYEGM